MFKNCVFKTNVDTIKWIKSTIVRCIRTFSSTVVALLPTTYGTLGSIDWKITFSSATLATVIIFFSCLAGIPEVSEEKKDE